MTRASWIVATSIGFASIVLAAPADGPIFGRYASSERDHGIELFLRDKALCGRITWTKEQDLPDAHNEDPKLRSRRVAGIEHIRGFVEGRDGVWTGGTLYNPEDGKTYEAKLWLDGDNRLIIQGRPKVPLIGGILGALFGRISYARETAR